MVWGAIIGAAAGIGSAIFGASSANSQAKAQNKAAAAQADREYERAKKEWEIGYVQDVAQWQWDTARIEQLRFNERQSEADYNAYNAKLIAAAMTNLQINQGALADRFVTEEALRGTQVGLEYGANLNRLGMESTEALRQYLGQINQAALESNAVVARVTGETQELLGSLALEQQRDQLGWQINQIASMVRDAEARGAAVVRQGGGPTAQRMAADAARDLGRRYGELVMRSQDRGLKVDLMNRTMQNDVSNQLARSALQTQDAADRMKYTNLRYQADYDTTKQQMEKLTIPSFGLAQRQYGRELAGLQLQTQQVLDQASMPYRQQTYFDPLKPIKGLAPELVSPTKVAGPSAGSVIASSLIGGAQGAMKFSYQKQGGGIGFY